jgi:hypothetical protein
MRSLDIRALTTTAATTTTGGRQQLTLELSKLCLQLSFADCQPCPFMVENARSGVFVPKWNEVFLFFWVLAISDSMSLIYKQAWRC